MPPGHVPGADLQANRPPLRTEVGGWTAIPRIQSGKETELAGWTAILRIQSGKETELAGWLPVPPIQSGDHLHTRRPRTR